MRTKAPAKGNGEFYRAGTAPGYILHEGRRQTLKRPRVRRKAPNGSREEILTSYAEAQDAGELHKRVLTALKAGVSGREQSALHDSGGKSTVSRLWAKEGEKVLSSFRSHAIDRADWLVLMLDGVALERDLVAVVALGISADGVKQLLDFEFGATENSETSKNLLARLTKRGFSPAKDTRLLCVLDGSSALKTAVSAYYPFRNVRRKTGRVCRWRKETNQASRWLSMALLEGESGFRRLRNHADLAILREALRVHRE